MDFKSRTLSWKTPLALLILLLALVQYFWPMLFDDKVPFSRDFHFFVYPTRFFVWQSFHAGVLPWWNPYLHFGTPFYSELYPGVFYPPSILFFLNDFPLALNLFYFFHFLMLAVGVYFLMRSWKVSATGSLASAITASLSGCALSSVLINYILPIPWVPYILLAFQAYLRSGKVRWFMVSVILLACQALSGNAEMSILTCALLLFTTWYFHRGETPAGGFGKRTVAVFASAILAVGLVAFQLVPTAELMKHSKRSGGLPFAEHSRFSSDWEHIAGFFLPHEFSGMLDKPINDYMVFNLIPSVYMGIFAPLFLILAFRFWNDPRIRFWVVTFFIGLFLALGENNPLYELLYPWVPYLNRFRYPEKFLFLCQVAAIFIVGLGWDRLWREARERTIDIRTMVVALLGLSLIVFAVSFRESIFAPVNSYIVLLIFGLTFIFGYFNKVPSNIVKAVFLILLLMDLTVKNLGTIPLVEKDYYLQPPILLESLKKDSAPYRVYSGRIEGIPNKGRVPNGPSRFAGVLTFKQLIFPQLCMLYDVEIPDGHVGATLILKSHAKWTDGFKGGMNPTIRKRILKRSNVKHWITEDIDYEYMGLRLKIEPERLQVFPNPLPRAYLVPNARKESEDNLLEVYYSPEFNPLDQVLLEQDVAFTPSADFTGEVTSIAYKPNQATITTRQTGNGFLVLMDSYFPGWTVTVDGQPGEILRANHYYRAVQLGPGEHTLKFEYLPEGLEKGIRISLVTLVLLGGVAFWARRGRKREY